MSLPTATRSRFGFVRQYPFDLAVTSIVAVAAYVAVTTLPSGSYARLGIALPLIVFLPGYSLVSALFPASARPAREGVSSPKRIRPGGIDTTERLGLSLVLSLMIVPILLLALAPTEWHLTTESTAAGLVIVTVVFAQLGAIRRLLVPEPDRYSFAPRTALARVRGPSDESALATVSSVVLVLGIVAAGVAIAFGLLAPQATAGFTELGLYAEDDDGDLVTDELPEEIEPGESIQSVLEVENQEGAATNYTVVVQEHRLEDGEVVERAAIDEVAVDVDDGETATTEIDVTPTAENDTVRITYLLFEGDAPDEPTRNDAMEDVYFWVTVSPDDDGADTSDGTDEDDDDGEVASETDDEDADEESTEAADEDESTSDEDDGAGEGEDDTESEDEGPEIGFGDESDDDASDDDDDVGDDNAGDDDDDTSFFDELFDDDDD